MDILAGTTAFGGEFGAEVAGAGLDPLVGEAEHLVFELVKCRKGQGYRPIFGIFIDFLWYWLDCAFCARSGLFS